MSVLFVDVGPKTPVNLGIEAVEVIPAAVAPGARFEVRVRVRATPGGFRNEVLCQIDGKDPARQPVTLEKDQTHAVVAFERAAPIEPGPHGLKVGLVGRDVHLPADDERHATLTVRRRRKMLTLVEGSPAPARVWDAAQQSLGSFENEMLSLDKAATRKLDDYAVVALLQPTRVPPDWWAKLGDYVKKGGGLAVVPGGDEIRLAEFNENEVLPAHLTALETAPAGKPALWKRFQGSHPLIRPFVAWQQGADPDFAREESRPLVRRYWRLGPMRDKAGSVIDYENGRPALAERAVGSGRVLLFTTPLDQRRLPDDTPWTNFFDFNSSFGLVLIDRTSRYLAGEETPAETLFACGVEPTVRVPAPLSPPYSVAGPGLSGAELSLRVPAAAGEVAIPQARQPGNYTVFETRGDKRVAVAGFSLDVAGVECDLTPVPKEELEGVFGEKTLVEQGRAATLREALAASRPPPVELLPYLLLALLGLMTAEGVFANRFYRPDTQTAEARAA